MQTKTALGEKLAKAGFLAREVAFNCAITEFLNNGGTVARMREMVEEAAEKMRAAGLSLNAEKAAAGLPDSAQPNAGKGLSSGADKANERVPDPASLSAAGRILSAVSKPKKMPGHAKPVSVAAMAMVQASVAKSLFDTRLPDGRKLREVSWAECPTLARNYRRLSRVLMAVHQYAVPADPTDTLDRIVNEEQLKEIFGSVERFNDVH